tara:strand:+ start:1002 stop:1910 length:909 start_codon:yes stop_codon:yes gene_type:complete
MNIQSDNLDEEINLLELLKVLWEGKIIIISLTAFASIFAVVYSLSLPNVYESKALLAPVDSSSSISGALGSYRGLAGLTGINLPSGGSEANSEKAMETIKSLSFFEKNILTNIFLPDLMALESWSSNTNKVIYDERIYKTSSNSWEDKPSAQQAYKEFTSKHLRLGKDKNSGFITISIKHQSPFLAKQWAELVINEVNDFYRQKDKEESEKAVRYLNQQISMTGSSEIKQVLAELVQEETKKLTLIDANEFYVFEYIDPPAVMEKKSEPNRANICIIIAFLGGILSILIVFIRHYFFNERVA